MTTNDRAIYDEAQAILELYDDIYEHKQHIKLDEQEIARKLHKIQYLTGTMGQLR